MVFAMSNGLVNNIAAFAQDAYGRLTFTGNYITGGAGTGENTIDPLISQGSLILSPDERYLFAINAGDNSISSLRIRDGRLMLADVVSSGGLRPNSMAMVEGALYVTNRGDDGGNANLVGFQVAPNGGLTQMCGAVYPLSTPDAQPSCVTACPSGCRLVVSERTTNRLTIYNAAANGLLSGPVVYLSNGDAPFGSAFTRGQILLVCEAGPDALSSYALEGSSLRAVSVSVANGEQVSCWVAPTPDGRYAYTTNAGSGSITQYAVDDSGALGVVATYAGIPGGMGVPIDCGVDPAGRYFYTLNGNDGSISAFAIGGDGSLTFLDAYRGTELRMGAQGLAVMG